MKAKKFLEEQIFGVLREAEAPQEYAQAILDRAEKAPSLTADSNPERD